MNNNTWKEYNESKLSNATGLNNEHLDSWLYNSKSDGVLSGVSKEFTLTGRSNVVFEVGCYGYAGCPVNFGVFITRDKQIIKEESFKFDAQGSKQMVSINETLPAIVPRIIAKINDKAKPITVLINVCHIHLYVYDLPNNLNVSFKVTIGSGKIILLLEIEEEIITQPIIITAIPIVVNKRFLSDDFIRDFT